MYVNINITYWVRIMLQPRTCILRVDSNYIVLGCTSCSLRMPFPSHKLGRRPRPSSASTSITFDAPKNVTEKGYPSSFHGIKMNKLFVIL